MRRRFGTMGVGIAVLGLNTAAHPQVATVASPLRSFDWTYGYAPEPGNRHWSSPDGVVWTETYPSGHTEVQRVAASAQVLGCHGVITTKIYSPASQTFIPDPGCRSMALLFRFGDQPWGMLGGMRSESATWGRGQGQPIVGTEQVNPNQSSRDRIDLSVLREVRSERLKTLLKHKASDKRYRRMLAAFLEADSALQTAIIERLAERLP
jgi:hypothetical protein